MYTSENMLVYPQQYKISVKDNSRGFQFGNFRYIFKQTPLSFGDDGYINEIHISTCDDRSVTKLRFNTNFAMDMYRAFVNIIQTRDSFDMGTQFNSNNEVSRIYGCYDFANKNYIIEIEKEETYLGNKSIIKLVMDDDDFREFVFLFYFHFLIALIG